MRKEITRIIILKLGGIYYIFVDIDIDRKRYRKSQKLISIQRIFYNLPKRVI